MKMASSTSPFSLNSIRRNQFIYEKLLSRMSAYMLQLLVYFRNTIVWDWYMFSSLLYWDRIIEIELLSARLACMMIYKSCQITSTCNSWSDSLQLVTWPLSGKSSQWPKAIITLQIRATFLRSSLWCLCDFPHTYRCLSSAPTRPLKIVTCTRQTLVTAIWRTGKTRW
jgi:hypothetical protein